jgi:hypothetical protein
MRTRNSLRLALLSICISHAPEKAMADESGLSISASARAVSCGSNSEIVDTQGFELLSPPDNLSGAQTEIVASVVSSGRSDVRALIDFDALTMHTEFSSRAADCGGTISISEGTSYIAYHDQVRFFVDESRYPLGSTISVPITVVSENNAPTNSLGQLLQSFSKGVSFTNSTFPDRAFNFDLVSFLDSDKRRVEESGSIYLVSQGYDAADNHYNFVMSSGATTFASTQPYIGSDLTKVVVGPLPVGVACTSASGVFPLCSVKPTVVFYINGIRTSALEAGIDKNILLSAMLNSFGGDLPTDLTVRHVYNPTSGGTADLGESVQQRLTELGIRTTESIGAILSKLHRQPEMVQLAVRDEVLKAVQTDPSFSIVAQHIAEFRRTALNRGNNIILVAHSQGNLFANLAYSALSADEQRRTRLLSVATPSGFTAGNGPHTTDWNDIIGLIPTSRRANVLNTKNIVEVLYLDFFGHSFSRYYMLPGYPSEQKILGDLNTLLSELRTQ